MNNQDLDNQDWKQAFPAIPDEIHTTIVNTLNQLEERTPRKMLQISRKKIFLIAAALTLTFSTTVAAAELIRWHEQTRQVFQADEIMQNRLAIEGVSKQISSSVTDQGITIEAIQTIQDQNYFYALFEVIAEDETILLTENHAMNLSIQSSEGKEDLFSVLTWGFVDTGQQSEISNRRYFEIWGTKHSNMNSQPLNLLVEFQDLQEQTAMAGPGKNIVSGNWSFQLDVNQVQPKMIEPNKTVMLGEHSVFIKRVELTPLTITLVCDGTSVRKLEQALQLRLNELDTLYPLQITGIQYSDGTILEESRFMGLTEGYAAETGDYVKSQRFTTVVDTDQVESLFFGDEKSKLILY